MPGRCIADPAVPVTDLYRLLFVAIAGVPCIRVHRLFPLTALMIAMAGVVNVAQGADLLTLYIAKQPRRIRPWQQPVRHWQPHDEQVTQAQGSNGFATGVARRRQRQLLPTCTCAICRSADRPRLSGGQCRQAFVNKPLYRPANDAAIEQANVAVKLAELSPSAEMDVANRLAQAYFDVLLAQDNVRPAEAQKVALYGTIGTNQSAILR